MVAAPDQVESMDDADEDGDDQSDGFVERYHHYLPIKF